MKRLKFHGVALSERDREETNEIVGMEVIPSTEKAAQILRLLIEYGREEEEKENKEETQ